MSVSIRIAPKNLIILFTKYPQVGKCKTRMITELGSEAATHVHKLLVTHTLNTLKPLLTSQKNIDFKIYYHGGTSTQMQQWLGKNYLFKQQQGKDLGERMATALVHALTHNYNSILIGSDCPEIHAAILEEALVALDHNDIVIGPAHDGGYYLIGVAAHISGYICKKLFNSIPWGTEQVLQKTLQHVDSLNLKAHFLTKLHDIDTAEDLQYFNYCPHSK